MLEKNQVHPCMQGFSKLMYIRFPKVLFRKAYFHDALRVLLDLGKQGMMLKFLPSTKAQCQDNPPWAQLSCPAPAVPAAATTQCSFLLLFPMPFLSKPSWVSGRLEGKVSPPSIIFHSKQRSSGGSFASKPNHKEVKIANLRLKMIILSKESKHFQGEPGT